MKLLLIALYLLLSLANAEDEGWHEMTDGSCPTLSFDKTWLDMDIPKFVGTWFQVKHYSDAPRSLVANCRNLTQVEKSDSDGLKFEMIITDKKIEDGTCRKTTLSKQEKPIEGEKEDGIMFAYLDKTLIAKYRLIAIDYDLGYYLTYCCKDVTYNGQTKKSENVFVTTRKRNPSQEVRNTIDLKMKELGLERFLAKMEIDNQEQCECKKPTGWDMMKNGFCPSLKFKKTYYNIDLKKYAGTWYQIKHYADVPRDIRANCRNMTLVRINEEDEEDNIKFKMLLTDKQKDGTCKTIEVIKKNKDNDGNTEDGIFFGYLGDTLIAKYRMIDIDFKLGYYLTYSCKEANYNGQTKHAENVFVKTRDRLPGAELKNKIDNQLKQLGLKRFVEKLETDNQEDTEHCACAKN